MMNPRCAVAVTALALVLIVSAGGRLVGQAQEKVALKVLPRVTVTVVVDNMAGSGPVLGEWGLSYLIDTGTRRVLLDAGAGRAFSGNAEALKIDLAKLDAIVVSHGHGDHTGGLDKALEGSPSAPLYLHPAALTTRYWKSGTTVQKAEARVSKAQLAARPGGLHETAGPTLIGGELLVTGQVPRVTDFEDTGLGAAAFLDADLKTPDTVPDDQAIVFQVPEGVVILVGCAHAGIINTVRHVSALLGQSKIYAVMGGTHLLSASPARLEKTIAALRQSGVERVMLSHCTGMNAYTELVKAFPGKCSWPASGSRVVFGR